MIYCILRPWLCTSVYTSHKLTLCYKYFKLFYKVVSSKATKKESSYDKTSAMCSKCCIYRRLLFTFIFNPFCKFGALTLKESYRMHTWKKKRLNLWLCLLYSNERLACFVWTTETTEIFQDSKMQIFLTSSIYLSMRLKAIMPSIFTNELTLGKSIVNLCTKLILCHWREQTQTAESLVKLKEEKLFCDCSISSAQFKYSWNNSSSIFQLNSILNSMFSATGEDSFPVYRQV